MSDQSSTETSAAPEWLIKLENRREKLTKGKLGHEIGAGAACNICNDKCPGLDLHFWRKVCRNCKCRKDQHTCVDNETTCWAQFDILGQIKSKSAYIKISALAEKPVKLDWVPPNVDLNMAAEYMAQLDSKYIPISGSNAAVIRKQQLQYQVPLHDLDPTLCDNLTENETQQLEQYAERIKNDCVGQGQVWRVHNPAEENKLNVATESKAIVPTLSIDTHLYKIINSTQLNNVLMNSDQMPRKFNNFHKYSAPNFMDNPNLLEETKILLHQIGIEPAAISSCVIYGPVYDEILNRLFNANLDVSNDPLLGPLHKFRQEYFKNDDFKNDLDNFVAKNAVRSDFPTDYDSKINSKIPISLQSFIEPKQDLLEANCNNSVPTIMAVENKLINYILNSVELRHLLHQPAEILSNKKLILSNIPMQPDLEKSIGLSENNRQKLVNMGLNTMAIESAIVSGPQYDNLFQKLNSCNVNYGSCRLLAPIKSFRDEYLSNNILKNEANNFVAALNDLSRHDNNTTQGFLQNMIPVQDNPCNISFGMHMAGCAPNNLPSSTDLIEKFPELSLDKENKNIPNIAVMKCKSCAKDIFAGTVAVKTKRAGKNVAWHPECFVCNRCGELLADLVYFYHNGDVYCARDLAIIMKIPRCNACDELIFTNEYTAAEESTYHIKHFCCYQCDIPLAGQQYVPDDQKNVPFCLKCFDQYYAKKCQHCLNAIRPTEQGVSYDQFHWHGTCFVCAGLNCQKSLIGERFCIKNLMPFCSSKCVRSKQ